MIGSAVLVFWVFSVSPNFSISTGNHPFDSLDLCETYKAQQIQNQADGVVFDGYCSYLNLEDDKLRSTAVLGYSLSSALPNFEVTTGTVTFSNIDLCNETKERVSNQIDPRVKFTGVCSYQSINYVSREGE